MSGWKQIVNQNNTIVKYNGELVLLDSMETLVVQHGLKLEQLYPQDIVQDIV